MEKGSWGLQGDNCGLWGHIVSNSRVLIVLSNLWLGTPLNVRAFSSHGYRSRILSARKYWTIHHLRTMYTDSARVTATRRLERSPWFWQHNSDRQHQCQFLGSSVSPIDQPQTLPTTVGLHPRRWQQLFALQSHDQQAGSTFHTPARPHDAQGVKGWPAWVIGCCHLQTRNWFYFMIQSRQTQKCNTPSSALPRILQILHAGFITRLNQWRSTDCLRYSSSIWFPHRSCRLSLLLFLSLLITTQTPVQRDFLK